MVRSLSQFGLVSIQCTGLKSIVSTVLPFAMINTLLSHTIPSSSDPYTLPLDYRCPTSVGHVTAQIQKSPFETGTRGFGPFRPKRFVRQSEKICPLVSGSRSVVWFEWRTGSGTLCNWRYSALLLQYFIHETFVIYTILHMIIFGETRG